MATTPRVPAPAPGFLDDVPAGADGGVVGHRTLRRRLPGTKLLRAISHNHKATVGALLLLFFIVLAVFPGEIAPYIAALHLPSQHREVGDAGTAVPQIFADQLGWRDFVREVGAAWETIPPGQRAHTAIVVDNYGEAAALDVEGSAYGFPPALSPHNQYGLWGLRGQHPTDVLRVQYHPERLRGHCATLRVIGRTFSEYAMTFENGKAIAYCTEVHPPLGRLLEAERFMY